MRKLTPSSNALLLIFVRPSETFFIPTGGVSTRFQASHDFALPMPMPGPENIPDALGDMQAGTLLLTKAMAAELEISVVGDQSHILFPGQRTVIRVRLLG